MTLQVGDIVAVKYHDWTQPYTLEGVITTSPNADSGVFMMRITGHTTLPHRVSKIKIGDQVSVDPASAAKIDKIGRDPRYPSTKP